MTLILAALACTTDVPIEEQPASPTPYIYEAEDSVTPELSVDDVETALSEVMGTLLSLNGSPAVDAYFSSMAGQQGDCPDYYENEGNVYWYDYCYSDDGSSFSGYGFGYLYEDYEEGGYFYNGGTVFTVAEVTTGDGNSFSGGGSAQDLHLVVNEEAEVHALYHEAWSSSISGAFSYDGPEGAGTWLNEDISPDLALVVYLVPENEVYPGYNGKLVQVQGGVGGFVGEVSAAVADNFTVWSGGMNLCPAEPMGMLSVRDTEGVWYDVVFDNVNQDDGETMDPDLCDGCGTVYVQGQAQGEACVDTTLLTDWTVAPW